MKLRGRPASEHYQATYGVDAHKWNYFKNLK